MSNINKEIYKIAKEKKMPVGALKHAILESFIEQVNRGNVTVIDGKVYFTGM